MYRFIVGNEIVIPAPQWAALCSKYSQDKIVAAMNAAITECAIAFPLTPPSADERDADYRDLCEFSGRSRSLFKVADTPVTSRYPYVRDMGCRYLDGSNVGSKFANYYHFDARMNCDSQNSPSPMRVWATPKFREGVLRALFSLKFDHVDSRVLAQCLALRKYVASQFRATSALAIYNRWAHQGDVLDMCSGWGDRLAGFLASTACQYTGFDPNLRLHQGYRQQIEYAQANGRARIHWLPFEHSSLPDNQFDLAFTSPPYFNIERYSKDEGQSFNYKTLDNWVQKFLYPLVEKTFESLRPRGRMIINISDVYSGHRVNMFCDAMNDCIAGLGAREGRHFVYRMAKRSGSKAHGSVFGEPCWVWIKR